MADPNVRLGNSDSPARVAAPWLRHLAAAVSIGVFVLLGVATAAPDERREPAEQPAPSVAQPVADDVEDLAPREPLSIEDYRALERAVQSSCAEPCPEGGCARAWCARQPRVHLEEVVCEERDCFAGFHVDGESRVGVVHLRADPRDHDALFAALDPLMASWQAGLPAQDGTPPERAAAILSELDSTCADVWCEGEYDFRFRSVACASDRCTLGFTAQAWEGPTTTARMVLPPGWAGWRMSDQPELFDAAISAGLRAWEMRQPRAR